MTVKNKLKVVVTALVCGAPDTSLLLYEAHRLPADPHSGLGLHGMRWRRLEVAAFDPKRPL